MQKDDSFITNNDKAFILKALQEELRIDGRKPYDIRKVKFNFSLDDSTCTVTMGTTRVMTAIAAALEPPYPDRPSEGSIRFNVELSPMASPGFEPGRPGEDAVELARLVERGLKQSKAIDTEALCVLAGRKVWSLRVDTHVLDHGGNLVDACCLSALAALMAFRKPEVTVGGTNGTEIVVHPPEVKEPLPLTIHHLPVSVTFGLFEDGNVIVIDPSLREEAAMQGSATIMMNPNKEVCAVHKAGGVGLSSSQLFRCVRLAGAKAEELVAQLKGALEQHEVQRVQARVRRHWQPPAGTSSSSAAAADADVAPKAEHMQVDDAQEAPEHRLAAELGIELKDEDMASSSSSEEGDDEDALQGGRGKGTAGAAAASAAQQGSLKGAGTKATIKSGGAATLKPSVQRTKPAAAAKQQKQPVKVKKENNTNSKRAPDVKYDELEAIAAVIAGAGSGPQEEVHDLADAVKKPKEQKKKK